MVAIHVADEFVLDPVKCYIDTPKLDLIGRMHGSGRYARTTDRFDIPRIEVADWPVRPRLRSATRGQRAGAGTFSGRPARLRHIGKTPSPWRLVPTYAAERAR